METDGYVGLAELNKRALKEKRPFEYDREIDGIRALDRYTIRFQFYEPRPRMLEAFAGGDLYGAIAREVIEFYGDQAEAHPVGTGPFRLVQWRRSSLLVFERNPEFRAMLYDAEPAPDDVEGQALLARFKGRRLPMVDRVEISIIEEEQPRWLAFVNDESDVAYRVGYQFAPQAMPKGKVAPNLAKRGIRGYHVVESAAQFYVFNMYPGIWRHGDWIRITPRGGAIIYGRSDATINRHGIRMGGQLLTMQFGREDESEADLVGLELAARAGYDPRGGVTLWQKMAAANERQPVELLSTHPSGPTRISNIEANLPKVEGLYARAEKPPERFAPP